MKRYKALAYLVLGLAGFALFLSFIPTMQFKGAFFGAVALVAGWFTLKLFREQNLEEAKVQKAIRFSVWSLIVGFVFAGACQIHSSCGYVMPFEDELAPIKERLNAEIEERNDEIEAQEEAAAEKAAQEKEAESTTED